MAKFAIGKTGPIKGMLPNVAGRLEWTERQDG
jgi:hypothetical protein